MRYFLSATLVFFSIAAQGANPPTKRGGGLFGFGAPKGEQISASLFPDSETRPRTVAQTAVQKPAVAVPTTESNPGASAAIFRGGQPQKIEPVSYVIEGGQKVQQNVVENKKWPSLLPFGKRGDSKIEANEIVTPVPAPGTTGSAKPAPIVVAPVPSAPVAAKPVAGKPVAAKPVAAKPVAAKPVAGKTAPPTPIAKPAVPATALTATPVEQTPGTPAVAKEDKPGWRSFLSRKKSGEPSAPSAAPLVATTVATPVEAKPASSTQAKPATSPPAQTSTTAQAPAAAKPPANSEAGSTPATVASASPTFEVPRPETKKESPKKEASGSSDGGLLSPIARIRPPRKEIDLSSAETIIQNGEIVTSSELNYDSSPSAPSSSGTQKQAPQVINGVKTYSSWDDIDARSTSAADKIIRQIR